MPARSRFAAVTSALLLAVPGLSACSGDSSDGPGASDGPPPEEVLATASDNLVKATGVQLALTAGALPEGVSGPAYATVVGMALVPPGLGVSLAQAPGARAAGGYLQRMGQWLRGSN